MARALPPPRSPRLPLLVLLLSLHLRCVLTQAACVKTPPGQRCAGAPNQPAVPWLGGCCVGACAEDPSKGWGKWCPDAAGAGGGEGACAKTPPGQRCAGAPGFPEVAWLGGCCVGSCEENPAKGWGKWCPDPPTAGDGGGGGGGGGGSGAGVCTKTPPGQRCAGAPGFPEVEWLGGCCVGPCAENTAKGWGKWCADDAGGGGGGGGGGNGGVCTKTPPGQRCAGAPGFPEVPWLGGCCQGECGEDVSKGWGKWCPGGDGNGGGNPDGENGGQNGGGGEYFLSDLPLVIAQSGFGPVEKDSSAGEAMPADGVPMSIAGVKYTKGLGVHSTSVVAVALQGKCSSFSSFVGVDDETQGPKAIPGGPFGSVAFEVFVDGESKFKSDILKGGDAAVSTGNIDLSGAQELMLLVSDGGDDFTKDHANWADAKLVCSAKPTDDTSALKNKRGEWGQTLQWPVKAIHASLLPGNGGKGIIVSHASKKIGEIGDNSIDFPHDMTKVDEAQVGSWSHQWVDRMGVEMYCSGHVVHNGGVLEFGGHGGQINFVYLGKTQTSRFDVGKGWTVLKDMVQPRWYPTALTLGNGEILSIAGSNGDDKGNIYRPEVYNPQTNTWRTLSDVNYQGLLVTADKKIILDDTYPFCTLASDGRVLWAGWDESMAFIDTAGNGAWEQRGQRENFKRAWASPLLIRTDDLLLVGGLDPALKDGKAVSSVVRMAFPGGQTPTVSYTGNMIFPRVDTQATILPDGTAFANGGGNEHRLGGSVMHIYPGEIYSHTTGKWTITASAANPRGYHSTALLLPDGRVWTAGGECSAEATGADNCPSGKTAEVFSPPYLFNGDGSLAPRPTLSTAPGFSARGQIQITSPSAVARVTMVRVGSATHHMNFDQRFLELQFSQAGGASYNVVVPENTNVVPPGHYLIFVLSPNGVPSEGKFIQFG